MVPPAEVVPAQRLGQHGQRSVLDGPNQRPTSSNALGLTECRLGARAKEVSEVSRSSDPREQNY